MVLPIYKIWEEPFLYLKSNENMHKLYILLIKTRVYCIFISNILFNFFVATRGI